MKKSPIPFTFGETMGQAIQNSKILIFFIAFLLFVNTFLFSFEFSFSYSPHNTHPALTEEMAEFFNSRIANQELRIKDEEIEWMKQGAINEDEAPRWINHFFDPIHKTGWSGKHFGVLTQEQGLEQGAEMAPKPVLASIDWATNQEYQSSYGRQYGNQTWQKAVGSYINGDKKSAFISLGYILHFIEDLSVPDHTRDDTHAGIYGDPGSPYENYSKEYTLYNKLNIAEELKNQNKNFFEFSSLESAFEYLADYSNKNFFSEDTINNSEFEKPALDLLETIEKTIESGERKYFYNNDIYLFYKQTKGHETIISTDDKNFVLPSYRSHLFPQAVLTGASVIDLFFKEVEKYKTQPELLEPIKQDSNAPLLETLKQSPRLVVLNISDVADKVFTSTKVFAVKTGQKIKDSLADAKSKIQDSFLGAVGLIKNSLTFFDFQNLKAGLPNEIIGGLAPDISGISEFQNESQSADQAAGAPDKISAGAFIEASRAGEPANIQTDFGAIQNQANESGALASVAPVVNSSAEKPNESKLRKTASYGLIPIPTGPGGLFLAGVGGGGGSSDNPQFPISESQTDSGGQNYDDQNSQNQQGGDNNQSEQEEQESDQESNDSNNSDNGSEDGNEDNGDNQNQDASSTPEEQIPPDTAPPDPPVIFLPSDFNQTFTAPRIIFEGTAEASSTIFAEFNSIIASTSVSGFGDWSTALDFNQGSSTVDFYAVDQTGNQSSSTRIFIFVDSIAPAIDNFAIGQCGNSLSGNGCLVATTTLNLSWSSDSSDIDYYELSYGAIISTTTRALIKVELSDGNVYNFSLRAKDKAGNWSGALIAQAEINTMPVVINEIAWGGTAGHSEDEFVELYNRANRAINLENWILYSQTDQKPWINLSGAIPAKGYYLIERTNDETVSDIPAGWSGSFGASQGGGAGLSNNGEVLNLVFISNNSTTTIDQTPEGRWPAGTSNGRSMERFNPDIAGSVRGNWGTNNMLIKNGKGAGPQFYEISATPKARNSANYLIVIQDDTLREDKILAKSNSPYLITDSINVLQGKTLAIEPGVVIKIAGNSTSLTINGILDSRGAGQDPIVFTAFSDDEHGGDLNNDATSSSPFPGNWMQILLSQTSSSTIGNTIFRYGGMWYNGQPTGRSMVKVDSAFSTIQNSVFEYSKVYGLELLNSDSLVSGNTFQYNNPQTGMAAGLYVQLGEPRILNNTFQNNKYGIYINNGQAQILNNNFISNGASAISSNGPIGSFSGNFGSNNGLNAIEIIGNLTSQGSTGVLSPNSLPYVLDYSPSVAADSTLIIQPNTVIKSASNLNISGSLFSQGENPGDIVFTSVSDDSVGGDTQNNGASSFPSAGNWFGINVFSGAYASLKGTTVKYGGARSFGANPAGINVKDGEIYLENVFFENNYLHGLRLENATSTIKNSEFKNHITPDNSSAVAYYNSSIHLENVIFSENMLGVYADPNSIVKTALNIVFDNNTSTTSPSNLW